MNVSNTTNLLDRTVVFFLPMDSTIKYFSRYSSWSLIANKLLESYEKKRSYKNNLKFIN